MSPRNISALLSIAILAASAQAVAQTAPANGTLGRGITTTVGYPGGYNGLAGGAAAAGAGAIAGQGASRAQQIGEAVTGSDAATETATPTAAEQGLESTAGQARDAYLAGQQALASTPRQRGLVVPVPAPADPVAHNPTDAGWLANWSYALERAGVPAWKVGFEANRLDRQAFGQWAWREIQVDWQAPVTAWSTPAVRAVARTPAGGR